MLEIVVEFAGLMLLGRFDPANGAQARMGLVQAAHHAPVLLVPTANTYSYRDSDDKPIDTDVIVGPKGQTWAVIPVKGLELAFPDPSAPDCKSPSLEVKQGPDTDSRKKRPLWGTRRFERAWGGLYWNPELSRILEVHPQKHPVKEEFFADPLPASLFARVVMCDGRLSAAHPSRTAFRKALWAAENGSATSPVQAYTDRLRWKLQRPLDKNGTVELQLRDPSAPSTKLPQKLRLTGTEPVLVVSNAMDWDGDPHPDKPTAGGHFKEYYKLLDGNPPPRELEYAVKSAGASKALASVTRGPTQTKDLEVAFCPPAVAWRKTK
jgi:hypothetical protein